MIIRRLRKTGRSFVAIDSNEEERLETGDVLILIGEAEGIKEIRRLTG